MFKCRSRGQAEGQRKETCHLPSMLGLWVTSSSLRLHFDVEVKSTLVVFACLKAVKSENFYFLSKPTSGLLVDQERSILIKNLSHLHSAKNSPAFSDIKKLKTWCYLKLMPTFFLRNSLCPPIHFSDQTWQRNQSARWQITNLEKVKSRRASRRTSISYKTRRANK